MIDILIYLKFVKQANIYKNIYIRILLLYIYYYNIIHYHFVLYDMNKKYFD